MRSFQVLRPRFEERERERELTEYQIGYPNTFVTRNIKKIYMINISNGQNFYQKDLEDNEIIQ